MGKLLNVAISGLAGLPVGALAGSIAEHGANYRSPESVSQCAGLLEDTPIISEVMPMVCEGLGVIQTISQQAMNGEVKIVYVLPSYDEFIAQVRDEAKPTDEGLPLVLAVICFGAGAFAATGLASRGLNRLIDNRMNLKSDWTYDPDLHKQKIREDKLKEFARLAQEARQRIANQ